MRAIVFATGESAMLKALNALRPTPMVPFIDRPFVQHVVETLAAGGFKELDLVLCHMPHLVENHLGDGRRWGLSIRYHLVRDAERPYPSLRLMRLPGDVPVLIAHADRLPETGRVPPPEAGSLPLLYDVAPGGDLPTAWTGWAWVSAEQALGLADAADEQAAAVRLAAFPAPRRETVSWCLDVRCYRSLLLGQREALARSLSGLMSNARQVEPGVWISRNVSLHPTARIEPPTYIGEDCKIGAGVHLGPDAVIGAGSMIDRRARVAESVVLLATYVGDGVELYDALAGCNLLVHAGLESEVTVTDRVLIDSLSGCRTRCPLAGIASRAAASVALVLMWPVLLASSLVARRKHGAWLPGSAEVVATPGPVEEAAWKTYRLRSFEPHAAGATPFLGRPLRDLASRVLPGLLSVARGHLRLVGVRPRTAAELRGLAPEWREILCRAPAGLITESVVSGAVAGLEPSDLEADVYYAATTRCSHDLVLLWAYTANCLRALAPFFRGRAGKGGSPASGTSPDDRLSPSTCRVSDAHASARARGLDGFGHGTTFSARPVPSNDRELGSR